MVKRVTSPRFHLSPGIIAADVGGVTVGVACITVMIFKYLGAGAIFRPGCDLILRHPMRYS